MNGERHREDGPAVEFSDGTQFWWINGSCVGELTPELKDKYPKIYDQLVVKEVIET
jgi:hypothetical protein